MKEVDVVSVDMAMPKPKFVRAPKKRWNWIPVAWSVNAVVWASTEAGWRRERRPIAVRDGRVRAEVLDEGAMVR